MEGTNIPSVELISLGTLPYQNKQMKLWYLWLKHSFQVQVKYIVGACPKRWSQLECGNIGTNNIAAMDLSHCNKSQPLTEKKIT